MIQIVSVEEVKIWDDIVKSFPNYDIHYLNKYVCLYTNIGKPYLFHFYNNECKAIYVFLERDISKAKEFNGLINEGEYFDISSPYGYGGFLTSGKNTQIIEQEFCSFCKSKGYISEFVRFNLFSDQYSIFDGKTELLKKNIVVDLAKGYENIYRSFRYDVRKNLRVAERNELKAIVDDNSEFLTDFLRIYYSTMDRNNAKENYYFSDTFFTKIKELCGNYFYVHVMKEDSIISTELVLHDKHTAYSFLGGTDSQYYNIRPNEFVKAEIIKHSISLGLKYYVLGGGYTDNDGIYKYKKKFAQNGEKNFYVGKRIFNESIYKHLCILRNIPLDSYEYNSYFPLYRLEI